MNNENYSNMIAKFLETIPDSQNQTYLDGLELSRLFSEKIEDFISQYISEDQSILPLEIGKINLVDLNYKNLNSKEFLIVPVEDLIKFCVVGLDIRLFENIIATINKEHLTTTDRKQFGIEDIITILNPKEFVFIWSSIIRMMWIEIKIIAAKTNRIPFITIEDSTLLLSHLKDGILNIFIDIFEYVPNIAFKVCKQTDGVKPLFKNKETIDFLLMTDLKSNALIDMKFLISLNNSFKISKFNDILRVFKSHREEIIAKAKELFSNYNSDTFISEFKAWYNVKLQYPEELIQNQNKVVELKYLIKLRDTKRDTSLHLSGLENDLDEAEKIVASYEKETANIIVGDISTYPNWIEKIPGSDSFVNFLNEKYQIKINLSLLGFNNEKIKEIKDTKIELKDRLRVLDTLIADSIIGQPQIITPLTTVIKRWFIGIRTEKPIGSFLFVGPTGVGKTETAKVLAKELFENLITLDMSEYQTEVDVSKIIGIAPGYIGYEAGGGLLDKVQENPRSIILFDEIEKAHPKVFDLLLQLLDEGRLTDNKGNVVSFKECLIIATSNAEIELIEEYQKKFNGIERKDIINILYTTGTFKKELLARFTDIIKFNELNTDTMIRIFNLKFNNEMKQFQLLQMNKEVLFDIDPTQKEAIAKFVVDTIDRGLGAREIERFIQDKVTGSLLDKLVELELNDTSNQEDKYYKFELLKEDNSIVWKNMYYIDPELIIKAKEFFKDSNYVDIDSLIIRPLSTDGYDNELLYITLDIKGYEKDVLTEFSIYTNCDDTIIVNDKEYSIGDGDDASAVWIEDGTINVWLRHWKEI